MASLKAPSTQINDFFTKQKGTTMFSKRFLLIILSLLFFQQGLFASPTDDVITGFNEPIQFANVDVDFITTFSKKAIEGLNAKLDVIYKINASDRSFDNTIRAYDSASDAFGTMYGIMQLLANAHPDDQIREAVNDVTVEFYKYNNELSINEDLYNSFKEYSKTKEG